MAKRNRALTVILAAVAAVLAIGAAAAWFFVFRPAPPDPSGERAVIAAVDPLRDRFVAAVRACGSEIGKTPAVVVITEPNIYFDTLTEGGASVNVPRWSAMPPALRAIMQRWAEQGTLGLDAEGQFKEVFNSLLVPHELGHWRQQKLGAHIEMDSYEGELHANRVALAFWLLDSGDKVAVESRVENFARFLEGLDSPVPAGEDERRYFNANYGSLSSNPLAYGWYQGRLMRRAWEERDKADFCTLIAWNGDPAARP